MSQLILRATQVICALIGVENLLHLTQDKLPYFSSEYFQSEKVFLLAGATFALCEIASRLEDLPKKFKDKD